MKNILFISSYPFPLDKGSNQHAYYFLKALCAGFRVHGFFFTQPGHDLPQDINAPLTGLGLASFAFGCFSVPPQRGRMRGVMHRVRAFPSPYMDLAVNSANLAGIDTLIREKSVDVMHIEHFHYAKYACQFRSPLKKTIVYHDLHHTIYQQKARLEKKITKKVLLWIDAWKYYLFQRRLDSHVHLKVFLNADEMARLPRNAVHLPHVVNQEIVYRRPRLSKASNLLFIGAFNHPPNVMSVAYILNQVLPRLDARNRRFRLHIVGSGTERFQSMVDQTPYAGSITVHGFVRDINEAFKEMDIALFPILYGGGIKTKIIDALAAGIPVVTTPQGVHGLSHLPEGCVAIGGTPDVLTDQVCELMDSLDLRMQRSVAGERYIRMTHSYDTFSDRVRQAYRRLCQLDSTDV